MIFFDLIRQQALSFVRSRTFDQSMAMALFMSFTGLYLAGCLVAVGFAIGAALSGIGREVTDILCGSTLYVMLACLVIRFFFQPLSVLNLQTYLSLPIRRATLVNYILLKPLFNPINYTLLLFVIPFSFTAITRATDSAMAVRVILVCTELCMFDTFLGALLKRKYGGKLIGSVCILAVPCIFAALEYFKAFSLLDFSTKVFSFIFTHPAGWLAALFAIAAAYVLNRLFFAHNHYIENKNERQKTYNDNNNTLLDRFGVIGNIISLELKMLWRNKVTRRVMITSIFLSVCFTIYTAVQIWLNPPVQIMQNDTYFYAIYVYIIIFSTILSINYGQAIYCYDSTYFDGLMTVKMPVKDYITANLNIYQFLCAISFVLSTPLFYFGIKYALCIVAVFLLNVGVMSYFMIYIASYNVKRMSINKASMYNTQGMSSKNFLVYIPYTVIIGLYAIISVFFEYYVGLIAMSVIGILGILLHKRLIDMCVRKFNERKYKMCEGFREN